MTNSIPQQPDDRRAAEESTPPELKAIEEAVDRLAQRDHDSAPAALEDRIAGASFSALTQSREPSDDERPLRIITRSPARWALRIAAGVALLAGGVFAITQMTSRLASPGETGELVDVSGVENELELLLTSSSDDWSDLNWDDLKKLDDDLAKLDTAVTNVWPDEKDDSYFEESL